MTGFYISCPSFHETHETRDGKTLLKDKKSITTVWELAVGAGGGVGGGGPRGGNWDKCHRITTKNV